VRIEIDYLAAYALFVSKAGGKADIWSAISTTRAYCLWTVVCIVLPSSRLPAFTSNYFKSQLNQNARSLAAQPASAILPEQRDARQCARVEIAQYTRL